MERYRPWKGLAELAGVAALVAAVLVLAAFAG